MNFPIMYKNGDYTVSIHSNGTKLRRWNCENPKIEFPESVDLKITNYCENNCVFCHEDSNINGRHAVLSNILRLINGLPSGVELAFGGGDPLSYPYLFELLSAVKSNGLIANMTVNDSFVVDHISFNIVNLLKQFKLIHGFGVSYKYNFLYDKIIDENFVSHMICGVHTPDDLRRLIGLDKVNKVLILGYKNYGRGKDFYSETVNNNILRWRYFLPSFLNKKGLTVSFDNLALEQLKVKDIVSEEIWNKYYMGNDGNFTMYVDAVNMEYGVSSISERHKIGEDENIIDLFKKVRN